MSGPNQLETTEAVLLRLSEAYETVKRVRRDLSMTDRIREDLDIDSLDAVDILCLLQEGDADDVFDQMSAKLSGVETVSDLVAALRLVN